MDDVSTDGANAAKAARSAEGGRRHKAISRLCRLTVSSRCQDPLWRTSPGSWGSAELPSIASSSSTRHSARSMCSSPARRGRRSETWVLPKATEQIIEETIHNVYLKPTRPTLTHLVDRV